MPLIKGKNFSRNKLGNLQVSNDDVFENCNFSQITPHTRICKGYTGLIFRCCNLLNCDIPDNATIENCLIIQKSLCSNLYPDCGLPECPENCEHVIDIDEVWIDGILIDKIYHYEDTIV